MNHGTSKLEDLSKALWRESTKEELLREQDPCTASRNAWVEEAERWKEIAESAIETLDDLVSRRVDVCAWCEWRSPSVPSDKDVLRSHLWSCEAHPMRGLKAENAELKSQLEQTLKDLEGVRAEMDAFRGGSNKLRSFVDCDLEIEKLRAELKLKATAVEMFVGLRQVGKFIANGDFQIDGKAYIAAKEAAEASFYPGPRGHEKLRSSNPPEGA